MNTKRNYSLVRHSMLALIVLSACMQACGEKKDENKDLNSGYSISGVVSSVTSTNLQGVTISLKGYSGGSNTTTTDVNGYYRFIELTNDLYTITPGLDGYTFDPQNQSLWIGDASITANFKMAALADEYSLSGKITLADRTPVPGIVTTLTGSRQGTTTTDANGNYSFTGLWYPNNYTVTPYSPGETFSPAIKTGSMFSWNENNVNFTMLRYSISGSVSGDIKQGVSLALTMFSQPTATTTTDVNGNYSFKSLRLGLYTITPDLTGYSTNPLNQSLTVKDNDIANVNFIATQATNTYSISGIVTFSDGNVLPGTAIYLSGANQGKATTKYVSGNYSFTGLLDGSYTITPWLPGYTVSPANIPVTIAGADSNNNDFTAQEVQGWDLAGSVSGDVKQGVILTVTHPSWPTATTTSDVNGNYIVNIQGSSGAYTVTPSLAGYTFSPANISVTTPPTGNAVSNNNFTAQAISTLPAPEYPYAMALDGAVEVTWNAVTGAASYNIYWATSPGVTPATGTKINTLDTGYFHNSLSSANTYYYVITAVDAGGVEGLPSTEVSAQPNPGMPI